MNFTAAQIETLRKKYSEIVTIDPCGDGYKNLTVFLDTLTKEDLIKLVEAKIKWISSLAQNRILRSKV